MILTKYGLERFLYRLAQSQYRDQFILKGALLFELWTHRPYRPTRDLDLEEEGNNSIARIKRLFSEIMTHAVDDDGLVFDPKSLRVARTKEQQEYEGLRVNLVARLERARIHMQVAPLRAIHDSEKFPLIWFKGGPWSPANTPGITVLHDRIRPL